MKKHLLATTLGLCIGAIPTSAAAAECATYDGTGYPAARILSVDSGTSSTFTASATFCGGSAGYTSDFYLASPDYQYLGTGNVTAPGTEYDLGVFAEGDELIFSIYVRNSGYTYYSGPGSRNPDGLVHAAVVERSDGSFLIGFEDLYGGGDRDYNDINLIVEADIQIVADDGVDTDGDGVDDYDDNCIDTPNADQADSDGDGIGDACDECPADYTNTCNVCSDGDGDTVCDDEDNCASDSNTDQADTDADGSGDACDTCPNDALNDSDDDGACDNVDTCDFDPENDADGDGMCAGDDECDYDAENDADGDTLCGDVDDCDYDAENDADADGICGDEDICDYDAENDADADGICGDVDICEYDAENDADIDGLCGDVDDCPYDADNDIDGDNVCGDVDNCADDANEDQADSDADGAGDACDVCAFDAEDDADDDGVCGDADACADTVLPDEVPTVSLGTNRWADVNGDGVFDTVSPRGRGPGRSYTIADTAGCSCAQIIDELDLGDGHSKFGCSISAMDDWTALVE
ncbi:MAG: hypothetical protein Q8P41_28660 [Pseudomonadota bacterium]|nr:hypothetical protein [Pseudomonadota bacterium]